jgi:hypothetical protein
VCFLGSAKTFAGVTTGTTGSTFSTFSGSRFCFCGVHLEPTFLTFLPTLTGAVAVAVEVAVVVVGALVGERDYKKKLVLESLFF